MQMAVIEASRNLLGLADAGSEEFDHEAGERRFTHVIYHLKEWLEGNRTIKREVTDDKGGTMRLGAYDAHPRGRQPGGGDLRHHDDLRAPPPPLRGRHRLPRQARGLRPALLRPLAGRPPAGDRRDPRPPLVHRRAVPPRAEVQALRPPPALRRLRPRRARAVAAGLSRDATWPSRMVATRLGCLRRLHGMDRPAGHYISGHARRSPPPPRRPARPAIRSPPRTPAWRWRR